MRAARVVSTSTVVDAIHLSVTDGDTTGDGCEPAVGVVRPLFD
jgi:hypothetical protein